MSRKVPLTEHSQGRFLFEHEVRNLQSSFGFYAKLSINQLEMSAQVQGLMYDVAINQGYYVLAASEPRSRVATNCPVMFKGVI